MTSEWFVASYVILWAITVCSLLLWVVLLRQIGVLHARWGPRSALQIEEGPELGASITRMGFPSFAGGELEVPGRHGLTLAILLSPNCGTCDELAPAVATVMADPPEDVRAVALIGGADRDAVEGFRENHRLDPRYSAFAPAATEMLNVQTIPTALVFDEEGKTLNKGVPNTLEQLEVLIAQTRDIDVEEPTDHAIHEQEQAVSAGR